MVGEGWPRHTGRLYRTEAQAKTRKERVSQLNGGENDSANVRVWECMGQADRKLCQAAVPQQS